MESVFQLIFHYTTKHRKINYFPGIPFKKKKKISTNKRALKKNKIQTTDMYSKEFNIYKHLLPIFNYLAHYTSILTMHFLDC